MKYFLLQKIGKAGKICFMKMISNYLSNYLLLPPQSRYGVFPLLHKFHSAPSQTIFPFPLSPHPSFPHHFFYHCGFSLTLLGFFFKWNHILCNLMSRLLLLCTMFLKFIPVVKCVSNFFLFIVKE